MRCWLSRDSAQFFTYRCIQNEIIEVSNNIGSPTYTKDCCLEFVEITQKEANEIQKEDLFREVF